MTQFLTLQASNVSPASSLLSGGVTDSETSALDTQGDGAFANLLDARTALDSALPDGGSNNGSEGNPAGDPNGRSIGSLEGGNVAAELEQSAGNIAETVNGSLTFNGFVEISLTNDRLTTNVTSPLLTTIDQENPILTGQLTDATVEPVTLGNLQDETSALAGLNSFSRVDETVEAVPQRPIFSTNLLNAEEVGSDFIPVVGRSIDISPNDGIDGGVLGAPSFDLPVQSDILVGLEEEETAVVEENSGALEGTQTETSEEALVVPTSEDTSVEVPSPVQIFDLTTTEEDPLLVQSSASSEQEIVGLNPGLVPASPSETPDVVNDPEFLVSDEELVLEEDVEQRLDPAPLLNGAEPVLNDEGAVQLALNGLSNEEGDFERLLNNQPLTRDTFSVSLEREGNTLPLPEGVQSQDVSDIAALNSNQEGVTGSVDLNFIQPTPPAAALTASVETQSLQQSSDARAPVAPVLSNSPQPTTPLASILNPTLGDAPALPQNASNGLSQEALNAQQLQASQQNPTQFNANGQQALPLTAEVPATSPSAAPQVALGTQNLVAQQSLTQQQTQAQPTTTVDGAEGESEGADGAPRTGQTSADNNASRSLPQTLGSFFAGAEGAAQPTTPNNAGIQLTQVTPTLPGQITAQTLASQNNNVQLQNALPNANPTVANVTLPAFTAQLSRAVVGGQDSFNIQLNPVELGRVDVQLTTNNDGSVNARVQVENIEAFDLFQRDLRTLERTLQQSGLRIGQEGIDLSLRDNGADSSGSQAFENARDGDRREQTNQSSQDDRSLNSGLLVEDVELDVPEDIVQNVYAQFTPGQLNIEV